MAISVDEYYKKLYKTGEQQLLDQENLIRQQADAAIKASDESYNTQIADVKQTYEDTARRNELQRVLNERHIERKAAEMGLTDSGFNRTQVTANQLSFANQQGDIDIARQKDINTLAAAMRAKRSELEGTRDSNIAQLKSDYDTSIRNQAVDLYEKEIESQGKYTYRYDSSGNVVGQYDPEDLQKDKNSLLTQLNKEDISYTTKKIYLQDYMNKYGVDDNISDLAREKGLFFSGGTIWNTAEFDFGDDTDKKTATEVLAKIFYSKKYDNAYRKAAFALYYDIFGLPADNIIDGLLYTSNMTEEQLMEGM